MFFSLHLVGGKGFKTQEKPTLINPRHQSQLRMIFHPPPPFYWDPYKLIYGTKWRWASLSQRGRTFARGSIRITRRCLHAMISNYRQSKGRWDKVCAYQRAERIRFTLLCYQDFTAVISEEQTAGVWSSWKYLSIHTRWLNKNWNPYTMKGDLACLLLTLTSAMFKEDRNKPCVLFF